MSNKVDGIAQAVDRKERAGKTVERIKAVNEFLADVIDGFKDTGLKDAVSAAAPWLSAVGETLAETVSPVRFVVKLFESLTRIDEPNELGYLACRLAYQQAIKQALEARGYSVRIKPRNAQTRLRWLLPAEDYDFSGFRYESAPNHAFLKDAEHALGLFSSEIGLDDEDAERIRLDVRSRFVVNLNVLLSHGDTREKFAPFRELIALGDGGSSAYHAIVQHTDYQRWLFEEKPVLGVEPFSLSQVYVDSDCGRLTWGEIETSRNSQAWQLINPFSEEHGGRKPLLEALLELIGDPELKDAVIIQGPAGSGKSSLTLRLCWELVNRGLRPIRIALKELDPRESKSIDEALPEAVRIDDSQRSPGTERGFFGSGLFLKNEIFRESIQFRKARICPYVLILDGWDEISIGTTGGYQQQVENMLRDIRQAFLERRSVPVRIILTGRPTDAIEKSKFLRKETVLLTLRQRTPEQLEAYVNRVLVAVEDARKAGRDTGLWGQVGQRSGELATMVAQFRHEFMQRQQIKAAADDTAQHELEVLGSPLLAHLALRLMVQWPGAVGPLLDDTTALYRSLVDMVISKGGKPEEADYDPEARPQITGDDLRGLLHHTAEAMTVLGKENLSYAEMEQWLQLDDNDGELERRSDHLGDNVLSRLMVSFFFQGGYRHLGCEFTHKSFREYLFAEMIVELLKQHGQEMMRHLPERPAEQYWQDFDEGDPRRELCRRLAYLLGPQWLSGEVREHVVQLIEWEIGRADGRGAHSVSYGTPTRPLSIQAWKKIRDSLADAWDWWGEGVHLRSRLMQKGSGRHREHGIDKPLAVEVAESLCSKPLSPKTFRPIRTVTVDAHLGDALLLLAQAVHSAILEQQGFPGALGCKVDEASFSGGEPRRCQRLAMEGHEWVVFAPSGTDAYYFGLYFHRMRAAGFGSRQPLFLASVDLHDVILRGAGLRGADLRGADLSGADLSGADLSGADLSGADLSGADLSRANLKGASLRGAYLADADLSGADLQGADFNRAMMSRANLSGANLSEAELNRANLTEADVSRANLCAADLSGVNFTGADLIGTDLRGSDLLGANLNGANLYGANLSEVRILQSQLRAARMKGADALGLGKIVEQ